mmetsp:Transcript_21022/g.58416  ORF Transcript_21022/g.58416 Transcript_21022/m.58416 type:complete len:265 (-) Transcript_21022:405-1199(-)|eukprot:CAMPEP_0202348674 /NCGR_PEP_ID=MMETSP1126-20121109/6491_1 /ASSEMBLY_ACC=CAM_ASM_000457 /TAXON_ID=3047 /ORGANISM="Dunaliella tertiolecta, Strain CCMP1320" /LENGTH=264 /DNA_ID=CAMNT_0048940371 /DNA_START=945 /DNA_END=1739 /DNA_ORIENTATION=+
MALQESAALLAKLKDAYSKNDLKTCSTVLDQLKVKLIQFPSLPPVNQPSPTAQQELALTREALEHACCVSIKQQDEAAMERAFVQLKVFYEDTRSKLPPSPQETTLQGLNLLRLLVQNRVAEFHTELELITPETQALPQVAHVLQMERWLMEGAYNKVLTSSQSGMATDLHAQLMSQLATTVRDEIASCCEKAYTQLKLADAQKMMMFDSEKAILAYAAEHNWQVQGGRILFQVEGKAGKAEGLPPLALINNALMYAKELERIV